MLFKKRISLCIVALSSFCILTLLFLYLPLPHHFEKMRRSIDKRKGVKKETIASSAHQRRQGVQKDLWITEPSGQRLHHRIVSEGSVLTFSPSRHSHDFVEHLFAVNCWMQEKLEAGAHPTQELRHMSADRGIYRYLASEFSANAVNVSLFHLPSNDLPLKTDPQAAFLRGVAQNVHFSLGDGKTPQLHAEHFRAKLQEKSSNKKSVSINTPDL